MKLDERVLHKGNEIRTARWRAGYPAGSPVLVFNITPLEPAMEFVPASEAEPATLQIEVTVEGLKVWIMKFGHLDSVADGLNYNVGHTNELQGRSEAYKFFDQGPKRDVVFVPRGIIETYYPHGVKVRTLAGETVIGFPEGTEPRLYGKYFANNRSTSIRGIDAIFTGAPPGNGSMKSIGGGAGSSLFGGSGSKEFGSGRIGIGSGGAILGQSYKVVNQTVYEDPESGVDDCATDDRYGTTEEYVNTVPPIIIIIGSGEGQFLGSSTFKGEGQGSVFGGGGSGGVKGASINALIKTIAKAAGFEDVEINTPDMGLREPFTVTAGATWFSAIQTLVGPWNPMIFVRNNILHVIDIEAVDKLSPSMTIGPENCAVISRRYSRLQPFRNLDVIGTLRRTLHKPTPAGAQIAREGAYDTPHGGSDRQHPYNITIVDSLSSEGTATTSGAVDSIVWTTAMGIKRYYINPDLGQSILLLSDDSIFGSEGPISRRVMAMDYHEMDQGPHAMIEQQYGILRVPKAPKVAGGPAPAPSISYGLIQQTYTCFDDNAEVEGSHDSHSYTDGTVIITYGPRGEFYKAMVYGDAAAGDTTDLSPGSLDVAIWCKISERHVTNHMYDQNVAHRRTVEIDSVGARPPRYKDEIFVKRRRGDMTDYDPRQRYCMPLNGDGTGTKSLYALFAATQAEAEMIRKRAARRSNARHVEVTVKSTTYIPGLVQGMAIRLAGTPLSSLAYGLTSMEHKEVMSGTFLLAGFEYERTADGDGRASLSTYLYLRSQF